MSQGPRAVQPTRPCALAVRSGARGVSNATSCEAPYTLEPAKSNTPRGCLVVPRRSPLAPARRSPCQTPCEQPSIDFKRTDPEPSGASIEKVCFISNQPDRLPCIRTLVTVSCLEEVSRKAWNRFRNAGAPQMRRNCAAGAPQMRRGCVAGAPRARRGCAEGAPRVRRRGAADAPQVRHNQQQERRWYAADAPWVRRGCAADAPQITLPKPDVLASEPGLTQWHGQC